MIKLFQILFYGHAHKWDTVKTVRVVDSTRGDAYTRFYLKCEHCGNMKTFNGREH